MIFLILSGIVGNGSVQIQIPHWIYGQHSTNQLNNNGENIFFQNEIEKLKNNESESSKLNKNDCTRAYGFLVIIILMSINIGVLICFFFVRK